MEIDRLRFLTVIAVFGAGLTPQAARASGDWYEAPAPTLSDYLQRLPAKSPGQILAETNPAKAGKQPEVSALVLELAERSKKESADKLLPEVDALLAKARAARCSPGDYGLIHDLRDVLLSAPTEAASYMAWRCDRDIGDSSLQELDAKLNAASKAMRPHWLYLKGAAEFNSGHKDLAEPFFARVVDEYPKHPRAEAALFMRGRCLVSVSRSDNYSETRIGDTKAHEHAQACFKDYLKRYPHGRFVADVYGWLGALAWDEDDYTGALNNYIQQIETPGHPENLKSAGIMMEKVLRNISQHPKGNEGFMVVARHPQAAMAMLYLVLGSPDAMGAMDLYYDDTLKNPGLTLREWRARLLPQLASAVAAQKQVYENGPWESRCLIILAHAASGAGKQEEALRLLAMAPKAESSDDLLFAKAIFLQRAGKPKEAIPVFRALLERYPSSPLAAGARIRFALALQDNHQAGMALVQLHKLVEQASAPVDGVEAIVSAQDRPIQLSPPDAEISGIESVFYPNFGNAETSQINQEIDTLLNFAPIPELATALEEGALEPGFATAVRAALASRALAHEDYTSAKRYMTPAQYGLAAAALEELTGKAAKAETRKEQPALQMRLGDAWAANRGKLLGIPLDTVSKKETLFPGDVANAEKHRQQNGKALGFKDADAELEAREELRHATRWWLSAARTLPGTPLSAAARLKVLEALAATARTNSYTYERAGAENLTSVSRQIYDRLQKECPDAPEAAQAAYWNASGTAVGGASWIPYGYYGDDDWRLHEQGYRWNDFGAFGAESVSFQEGIDEVQALRGNNEDVPALQARVKRLLSEELSPVARNSAEDLALFLNEPGVTAEMAHVYLELRLDVMACAHTGEGWGNRIKGLPENADIDAVVRSRIAKARQDPQMKPVRDYIDFLDAAVVANHRVSVSTKEMSKGEPLTYLVRDYPTLEKMIRAFLKEYPASKKREAARLLLARAVFRLSWPEYDSVDAPKGAPGSCMLTGPKPFQTEPFDPRRVMAELDSYDHDYPNGRYAADIRNMRAAVLWRAGTDWKRALGLTIDLLDNGPADLEWDASLRLANLFADLADPTRRSALLKAIRQNPRAVELLEAYIQKAPGNLDHPLVLMSAFLGDRLGFKVEAKPAATKPVAD